MDIWFGTYSIGSHTLEMGDCGRFDAKIVLVIKTPMASYRQGISFSLFSK